LTRRNLPLFSSDEAEARPEVVNSAQTSESLEIYKSGSPQEISEEPHSELYEGEGRHMKTSTKDNIKGSFHEVKGTIKEEVGKVTGDRNLKAEGKAEKKTGKVQQRIGHAKEAVADLKGQLADLKKTG
jgi:uncharacterized protein YjbJ (UPF0337 family)